jgi:hypothetical protein
VFTVEVLPAQRGDSLWLTYGAGDERHHVLIDAGPSQTISTLVPELERRLKQIPGRKDRVELLVVTHVDGDHIQGVVALLSDPARLKLFKDVWFNGFKHLTGVLGGPDGERLTEILNTDQTRWNGAFGGGPVVVATNAPEPLPSCTLTGGLKLTLLTPRPKALERLAPEWTKACIDAGIVPGAGAPIVRRQSQRSGILGFDPDLLAKAPYKKDTGKPNCTSITLLAEFDKKKVLLTGDISAEELLSGLDRLGPGPHKFAAVKIAHHGSRRNTNLALCEQIRSPLWLVSTDGAVFGHPDPEALARIVVTQDKPTFVLNYVTEHVQDLISNAGNRYRVRVPKKRPDGTFGQGVLVRLA